MAKPFTPERFSVPVINPQAASLFRRVPYIGVTEYKEAPTAVAINALVPGGSEAQQTAALAAVINRASDWIDGYCFHTPAGTLAACPNVETAWIPPKGNGEVALICNFKPILEVLGIALGPGPGNVTNLEAVAAEGIRIEESIIWLPGSNASYGPLPEFPAVPTFNNKLYVVWEYVNGFPHMALAATVKAGKTEIEVEPSDGDRFFGVYEGTQLTIHDGANTEIIVVESTSEPENEESDFILTLKSPLKYEHKLPAAPDSIRVTAVPWEIEQACISMVSYLIKSRGTRAMSIPQIAATKAKTDKQVEGQAGSTNDLMLAKDLLQHYVVPVMRSTA